MLDRNAKVALFGGVSVLVLCLSSGAYAQSATAPASGIQLEEIQVKGDKLKPESPTAPIAGYVARTTTTGTKTNTPLIEVPQAVAVVTRDQMDARGVTNLGQALTYSAGVVGEPFGSDARFDSPIIRGFSAATSQYLDGLALMRTQGMISIEPYGLERINVLHGPSSVLYGQGNPGGLIDMISKRPTWTTFGEVNAEGATFDRYTGSFDFGGPVAKGSDVAYRMTGLVRNGGTQIDHIKDDRYFFAPSLTWRMSEATTLTILASIQHDNSLSPVGLPNAYTLYTPYGRQLPRNFDISEPGFDHSDRTLVNGGYEFEHRFDNDWTFRQNARYTALNWGYQSLYFSGLDTVDPTIANRGASYNTEHLGTFTIDNQLEKTFETGPLGHTLLMGLDARRHEVNTGTAFGTAPSLNLVSPVYGVAVPTNIWYTSNVNGALNQVGLYGQDQVRFERWLMTLGLRHDWASTDSTTLSNFGNSNQKQTDQATTGRVGLTYLFDNGIAPYASYSTSFLPVIGNMPAVLGGAPFKPSSGEQYEIGVKYQPVGWKGFFSAALYDLTVTNLTSSELIGGVSYSVQTGKVRSRGLELSGVTSLAEGLNLTANYAYTDARIVRGDNAGNRPANVPMHSASLWLDKTILDGQFAGLGFGAGVRFVGARYDLDTNANKLPANTLFDASAHYEKDHYKLSVGLKNLTDVKYVATCGSFGCYYGDGRTIDARLTYKW